MDNTTEQESDFRRFIKLFPAIILGWIVIDLWGQVIESFMYSYMGYQKNSVTHSIIIAIIVSLILLFYVYYTNSSPHIQNGTNINNPHIPEIP